MKNTRDLLLKNSFRNTVAAWPVTLGLTLLICLLSLVISLMTSIGVRVVDNYQALNKASNKRDGLIALNMTDLVKAPDDNHQNNVYNQQKYVYDLEQEYQTNKSKYDFYWSRTEGRNFQSVVNGDKGNIRVKIVAKTTPNSSRQMVDRLAVSQGRNIIYDHDENITTAYDGIDSTYIGADGKTHARFGRTIENDHPHDIVLDATFANKNNIKIGDIIRVQEDDLGNQFLVNSPLNAVNQKDSAAYNPAKFAQIQKIKDLADQNDVFNKEFSTYNWLQVCGFGESADYVMPVVDSQSTLPNKDNELIAYVNPHVMGLYIPEDDKADGFVEYDLTKAALQVMSASDEESYYSFKFKDRSFKPTNKDFEQINQDFIRVTQKAGTNEASKQFVFKDGDKNYQFASRTTAIETTLGYYNLISGIILAAVALIVIFSVILISKKQIDKTRSQIGVMKALGYEKKKIVWNYTSMPFISSLTGGILGFIIAQGIQGVIVSMVNKYFNLDISGWSFDFIGFIICVVLMWFIISGVSFGIAYWVMRDDTLSLLNAAKASHMSSVGLSIKELNRSQSIISRTETSLFASNMGKMFSVTAIVVIATMVMTASFTLPTTLKSNQTKSYDGINYKQVIEYNKPVYNNPYTFLKTWDPTVNDQNYEYSKVLQKITSEPLKADGSYDMDAIMNQLTTGKISSEFYDLEFGASPDAIPDTFPESYTDANGNVWKKSISADGKQVIYSEFDKDDKPVIDDSTKQQVTVKYDLNQDDSLTGIPSALQGMTANMKMLAMYGVTLSNKYLKTISDWAIKDSFGWNILSNQWPDYLQFSKSLRDIDSDYNDAQNWVSAYNQLQAFYKRYVETVGLVVTRDYYNYNSKDEVDGIKPIDAYKSANYAQQIKLFNEANNADNRDNAFNSYKTEKASTGGPALGKLLTSGLDSKANANFQLSDGKNKEGIGINHIYNAKLDKDGLDHYLTDSADDLSTGEIKSRIKDYLTWYGAYMSQRSGTAIVMAAYSRPPYFVQQYAKKAYNANNNKDVYHFSFGTVPFNPDKDQLGTEIEAYALNGNRRTDFKIYGIQNNNIYVNLRDKNGNNLVKRLFEDTEDDNDETPGIVINESLATKLGLKTGDDVDTQVLYDELEQQTSADGAVDKFNIKDWNQENPRLNKDPKQGFITSNDMDTFNISVKAPDGKSLAFTAGNTNLTNAPSEFYQKWIDGNIYNKQTEKAQSFHVVGVHKGYGTPMAWVRNADAEKVMNYNGVRDWLWENLFAKQFGRFFADDSEQKAKGFTFSKEGTKKFYTVDNDKLSGKGEYIESYDVFNTYVNKGLPLRDDPYADQDLDVAKNILKVFNNTYPIFNYKYSMSDDIGDLQTSVSTWDETGGYSPIEENGGVWGDKNLDGLGKGALAYLLPIEVTKKIQDEISSVIMTVVAIIIALIVVLTFIIIMLTTSLIINDNARFISTMKVLGYSTPKIVNTILGMYAIAIVCAYVVGFIVGWFILSGTVHSMAMASSMVLPLIFPAWLIFAVMAAVIGIYAITFTIGFLKIQKANPIDSLKDVEL